MKKYEASYTCETADGERFEFVASMYWSIERIKAAVRKATGLGEELVAENRPHDSEHGREAFESCREIPL